MVDDLRLENLILNFKYKKMIFNYSTNNFTKAFWHFIKK